MERRIEGLHHVTAIAGDPQANINFYAGLLGLRLVKQTVNYDDPSSYHFYYGNGEGEPGTILTFFPWPGAIRGRQGTGQTTATALSVPRGSQGYWTDRLTSRGIDIGGVETRFGDQVLALSDPDGLVLELVESDDDRAPWTGGDVPSSYAIRGLHHVTLAEKDAVETVSMLEFLGYSVWEQSSNRTRYRLGERPGAYVDVVEDPGAAVGRVAAGTVHHIAFRTPDDSSQEAWLEALLGINAGVSAVQDRQYFRSIYFREPGGVLFEIATDTPGFMTDESAETLGTTLRLPSWYEPYRERISAALPRIELRESAAV